MKKYSVSILLMLIALIGVAQDPKDFTIPVKVTVNDASTGIIFNWPADTNATSYIIRRKLLTDESFADSFITIGTLNSNAGTGNTFTDENADKTVLYEYEIAGTFSTTLPVNRNTYLCAGIQIHAKHTRGTIILLCDNSITTAIAAELSTLYQDLVGDGWKVKRIDVARSDNPQDVVAVKNKILAVYQQNPDTRQVFIIGHVPVPYSGLIYPDGHTNHWGAWVADAYYGDMRNSWTDITANYTGASRIENRNVPGDGKFDRSWLTSVQLGVGRVDFSNLPSFSFSEIELLKRYFEKNHRFKTVAVQINKTALIQDGFQSYDEKFSQAGWKSGAANIGYDNVKTGTYNTALTNPANGGYMWSFGCGAGNYQLASGVCSTNDFATKTYNTVFTSLFGSYFGDWDSQDNLMRAALASAGSILTCVWSGRPHWFFHQMSAGFPIGYAALVTMNNTGAYDNTGHDPAMVHTSLLGDPSLRSNYIKPATNLVNTVVNGHVNLSWQASQETNITGYYIYRSNSITGNFTLLNNEPLANTSFDDTIPLTGKNVYLVRAVKLDNIVSNGLYNNNSTYFNLSEAIIDSSLFYNVVLPVNLLSFSGKISDCNAALNWTVTAVNTAKEYVIEYSVSGNNFQPVGKIAAVASQNNDVSKMYTFQHIPAAGNAFYRLKMIDMDGSIHYSEQLYLLSNCAKNTILIYPVPVTDVLHISISSFINTSENNAVLYDITGKLLLKTTLTNGNNSINLSALPKAVYNLCITINGAVKNYKIVK